MLHHLRPRLKVQSVIVGRTDGVTRCAGKLQLDMLMRPSLLMQQRASEPSKAMACHYAAVPHTLQREKDRVIAYLLTVVNVARKKQLAAAGDSSQEL
jgi:hypothetical protein